MIKNYDQEIEKMYHPENFEPTDLEERLEKIIRECERYEEFKEKLKQENIYLENETIREYWDEYVFSTF